MRRGFRSRINTPLQLLLLNLLHTINPANPLVLQLRWPQCFPFLVRARPLTDLPLIINLQPLSLKKALIVCEAPIHKRPVSVFWTRQSLEVIVQRACRFIRLDHATELFSKGRFARVAVDVDISQPLAPGVDIVVEDDEIPSF